MRADIRNRCVFEKCEKPIAARGACEDHQRAATMVLAGDSPLCQHGIPFESDCIACSLIRKADSMLAASGDAKALAIDAALRSLVAELATRGIRGNLGPHDATIATHIGVPADDGRVYRVMGEPATETTLRLAVHWGDRPQVSMAGIPSEVIGAAVIFFVGVRERARAR